MKRIMISSMVVIFLICLMIVLFGKSVVSLVDNFCLSPPEIIPTYPSDYCIFFSDLSLSEQLPNLENVEIESNGKVVLIHDEKFILGTVQQNKDYPNLSYLKLDNGDSIQFSYRHSCISWFTPFEMNFITGQSPNQKRNSYFHLTWVKQDGSKLFVRWRYEQWKYGDNWNNWQSRYGDGERTGIIDLTIEKSKN